MDVKRGRFVILTSMVGFVSGLAILSVWAQVGPKFKIVSPKDGQSLPGDTVTIGWEVSGVKIAHHAHAQSREEGHIHLFLDREDFRPGVEVPRDMEKEGIFHTAENSIELKGLKPGKHKVTLLLTYYNHMPWEPLVTATVSFTTGAKKKK